MSLMRLGGVHLVLVAGLALAPRGAAAQQQSRCADCHFANPNEPAGRHLTDWEFSAHGRNGVGCERCHGGDPTTFESFRAHQGILGPRNPASPVHPANLPRTCGACHLGPVVNFQKSRHYELLQAGDGNAPTCSTCHGEVAAFLPSPKALTSRCSRCHRSEDRTAVAESQRLAGLLLEGVRDVRKMLDEAGSLIRRVRDDERRSKLEYDYEQAEVPLTQAVQAGHQFAFDEVQERLAVSHERTEALLGRLANQGDH